MRVSSAHSFKGMASNARFVRGLLGSELHMNDLIFVLVTVLFFAVCAALVRFCNTLR